MLASRIRDIEVIFDSLDVTPISLSLTQVPEPGSQETLVHRPGTLHHVIGELLDTETAYLQNLEELERGYFKPLRRDHNLDPETLELIFGQIPALRLFHDKLLEDLQRGRSDLLQIAEVFSSRASQFEALYSQFCFNFDSAIRLLEDAKRRDSLLWSKVARCQRTIGHQLSVETYLLKPVQRILKYRLILQQCLKRCVEAPMEVNNKEMEGSSASGSESPLKARLSHQLIQFVPALRQALGRMTQVANAINERKRGAELNERLRSSGVEIEHLGKFVLHGRFHMVGKKHSRLLLLYNKALVICKYTAVNEMHHRFPRVSTSDDTDCCTNSTLAHPYELPGARVNLNLASIKARVVFPCKKVVLTENVPKGSLAFQVHASGKPKTRMTFIAPNLAVKRCWCAELRRLTSECQTQRPSNTLGDLIAATSRSPEENPAGKIFATASKFSREVGSKEASVGNKTLIIRNLASVNTVQLGHSASFSVPNESDCQKNLFRDATFRRCQNVTTTSTFQATTSQTIPTGSVSSPVSASSSRSSSPSSLTITEDNDFRCIALEINEERLRTTLQEAPVATMEKRGYKRDYSESATRTEDIVLWSPDLDLLHRKVHNLPPDIKHRGDSTHDKTCEHFINRISEIANLSLDDLSELWNPVKLLFDGSQGSDLIANGAITKVSAKNKPCMRDFQVNTLQTYPPNDPSVTADDAVDFLTAANGKWMTYSRTKEENRKDTGPTSNRDARTACCLLSNFASKEQISSCKIGHNYFSDQEDVDLVLAHNVDTFQSANGNHRSSPRVCDQWARTNPGCATPPPVPQRSVRKLYRPSVDNSCTGALSPQAGDRNTAMPSKSFLQVELKGNVQSRDFAQSATQLDKKPSGRTYSALHMEKLGANHLTYAKELCRSSYPISKSNVNHPSHPTTAAPVLLRIDSAASADVAPPKPARRTKMDACFSR